MEMDNFFPHFLSIINWEYFEEVTLALPESVVLREEYLGVRVSVEDVYSPGVEAVPRLAAERDVVGGDAGQVSAWTPPHRDVISAGRHFDLQPVRGRQSGGGGDDLGGVLAVGATQGRHHLHLVLCAGLEVVSEEEGGT